MKIGSVIHAGLQRLIEGDDVSGFQPAVASEIRRMLSFLQDMENEGNLRTMPNWKADLLTGERKHTWSLYVTSHCRMTFRINHDEIEIIDLDLEDDH
ncbi:type II toxin-antitoxin system RelE/ParE family toxin [Sphingobium cloacae]|uniref:type II toxin-antitoxin system RelE/ParE family toxin n=1 Tax=Sphingobium cloacae TaxID=120107 RepID=UPI0008360281|nr:type II toxin-antitoxin system RelE/ParE family toxin [Sphingobium cloacae]